MPHRDPTFTRNWVKEHPETTAWEIFLWTDLADKTDWAYDIGFEFEDWLPTNRTTPPPDLLDYIATYGYIRLRLQDWKLPIELSPTEMEQWRAAGYYVEMNDWYDPVARVAGGFLKLAGQEPRLAASIIQQQLDEKLAELERLADLPLERYTPHAMPKQIRQDFIEMGLKGKELEDAIEDELAEDGHTFEVREFEKPFTIRQQLDSFEWGMEKFRMFCQSEHEPDLGLPNQQLFDALMQIDLNGLLARLEQIDIKLRRIWQHLAKNDCYDLNAEHEPEQFWWRHWKKQPRKK
jgi:hypothetical protein